jgi:hypothetical protein
MKYLEYEGKTVRFRECERLASAGKIPDMLCLTDMWRAAGEPSSKRPALWRQLPSVAELVDVVTASDVGKSYIWRVDRDQGGTGGTWAEYHIGIAYANYLSPRFYIWCIDVVRRHIEGNLTALPVELASGATRDLAEIKVECGLLRPIHNNVIDLTNKFGQYMACKKKHISPQVRAIHVAEVARTGGRCPRCGIIDIVDISTKREIPNTAEADHFYQVEKADADHTWLICITCHDLLTTWRPGATIDRSQAQVAFHHYQDRRKQAAKYTPAPNEQFTLL